MVDKEQTVELLSHLWALWIESCAKLRALPEGLQHAFALKDCYLLGARGLREIRNIPSLQKLDLQGCWSMESISNLPALGEMTMGDSCKSLRN